MEKIIVAGREVFAPGRKVSIIKGTTIVFDDDSVVNVATGQIVNTNPEVPITIDEAPEGYERPVKELKTYQGANRLVIKNVTATVKVMVHDADTIEVDPSDDVDSSFDKGVVTVFGEGGSSNVTIIGNDNIVGDILSGFGFNQTIIGGRNVVMSGSTIIGGSVSVSTGNSSDSEPVIIRVPKGTVIESSNVEDIRIGDTEADVTLSGGGDVNARLGNVSSVSVNVAGDFLLRTSTLDGNLSGNVGGDLKAKMAHIKCFRFDLNVAGDADIQGSGGNVSNILLNVLGDLDLSMQVAVNSLRGRVAGDADVLVTSCVIHELRVGGDKSFRTGF